MALPVAVIWQAYGKTETRAELKRAANSIALSAPENGVAIVKIFGHAFRLVSGKNNSLEQINKTHWFTLPEIKANFRQSWAFRRLSDTH